MQHSGNPRLEGPQQSAGALVFGHMSGLSSPAGIPKGDMRRMLDRFQPENYSKNLELVDKVKSFAMQKGATPAQLALAWVRAHSKSEHADIMLPIPGATISSCIVGNSTFRPMSQDEKEKLDEILSSFQIHSGRYANEMETTLFL